MVKGMKLSGILEGAESVAVVGASPKTWKIGGIVLRSLVSHGFRGRVYPVNPGYSEVQGYRCYPSLGSLPEVPDIVAIAVPESQALSALEESARLGARLAVVFTSGGPGFTKRMSEISKRARIRVIGPNSAGIIVAKRRLYLTIEHSASPGHVAVVSQSGALGGVAMHWLNSLSSGVSFFISLGNMSDVGVCEALTYAAEDEATKAVSAYIEWLKNGARYMTALRRLAEARKPVCVVKGGRGPRSNEAARSHTGGVASNYEVFVAATRQSKAYVVDDVATSVLLCEAKRRVPWLGKRAIVVTNSGGLGVLIASRLEDLGYRLPSIGASEIDLVKTIKPRGVSGTNPIDLQGDATISQLVDTAIALSGTGISDFIILGYVPTSAETPSTVCRELERLKNARKPVILVAEGYGALDIARCSPVLGVPGVTLLAGILGYYS